jgi:type III pantothenate kinase
MEVDMAKRTGEGTSAQGTGDHLLVMDVGNTQTVVALFAGSTIVQFWRLTTARHRTRDEWGAVLQSLFHFNNLSMDQVSGVAISSVVPPADRPVREMVLRYFGLEAFTVCPGIKTGVPILYDHPSEVGADRIVNAVAVAHKYGTPAIVVDFGTATTFDVLNGEGAYVGGVIAPGLGISAEALFERAAKLPKVDIQRPPRVIGRTTVASMQSGLYWGYAALVEGLVRRMREEFGPVDLVPATGGLAPVIARDCPSITHVDENLTLEGLRILYERNR